MKKGLFFIWINKNIISEVIKKMENMKFKLVESLSVIFLNKEKLHSILKTEKRNITDFHSHNCYEFINTDWFIKLNHEFFCCSKLTLFIFRRDLNDKHLELRHQRNNDILFDIYNQNNPNGASFYTMNKIYKIIETLIPNANKNNKFGYIQIFGIPSKRKNWLNINQNYLKNK